MVQHKSRPPAAVAERTTVKSAARAIEVLELFRRKQRALSSAEVSRALGYPKSSTNVLLRSLTAQGYLVLDARTLRYFPSLSVTRLGEWIPRALVISGHVAEILEDIHAATQETVTLSVLSDLSVTFLKVIPGTYPISLQMTEGFVAPLFTTAIGIAILAQLREEELEELVHKANLRARRRDARVDVEALRAALQETREKGFCVRYDAVISDTGAIGIPFPSDVEGFPMALGVAGLSSRIRRHEKLIYREVRACLARHAQVRPAARRVQA
ncbi:MAG TPA: IclR family transcriptional regulator C-terminal domain-containing protein [Steroidobacteraceae bacterium]|nr:IclR family transcriptional regulator C-terminal domain-containing protein [Steroidobacteraceae bacterium]